MQMQTLRRDIAVGWRRLRATPAFTAFSILTIALGIAAVTGAYAVVRAAVAPPSGVGEVRELLHLSHTRFGSPAMVSFSFEDFNDLRARQTTMTDLMAFTSTTQILVVNGQARSGLGELVSPRYFEALRVQPALGRTLQPADHEPDAAPVAVISYDTWQRVFAARSDVVGQTMRLGGLTVEVVGVAPPGFVGLFASGRFPAMSWVPLEMASRLAYLDFNRRRGQRTARWLHVRGRARAGVSLDQVAAEVRTIGAQLDQEQPLRLNAPAGMRLPPYQGSRDWVVRRTVDLLIDERSSFSGPPVIVALITAVALVLLVACSNLANLVVARGAVRRHELALRIALGAPRSRLMLDCMAEALLIVAAGTVLGLALAWAMARVVAEPFEVRGGVVLLLQPRIDLAAFGVSLVAACAAILVAGVIPAAILTRRSSHAELVSGGAPTIVPRWRARRVLIAAQVAVSIGLLSTAALFLGQVAAAASVETGLDVDRFALAEVDLTLQNYDDVQTTRLVDQTLDRLRRHPAIESAAVSTGLPVVLGSGTAGLRATGAPIAGKVIEATPELFRTVGIPIVRGRSFGSGTAATPDDAIVESALAQQLFGREDVVGEQIAVSRRLPGRELPPTVHTIVGVVPPVGAGVRPYLPAVYLPYAGHPSAIPLVFTARTSDSPARIAGEIRSALLAADPAVGIANAGSGRAMLSPSTGLGLVAGGVAVMLGAIGLAVVLAGLSGVLSYLVSRRTREIGMRLALGATPRHVMVMVIREGLVPVCAGIVPGAAAAIVIRQGLAAGLYLPRPSYGVLLLCCVPVVMLMATAVACYFPARRAAQVNPAAALKQ